MAGCPEVITVTHFYRTCYIYYISREPSTVIRSLLADLLQQHHRQAHLYLDPLNTYCIRVCRRKLWEDGCSFSSTFFLLLHGGILLKNVDEQILVKLTCFSFLQSLSPVSLSAFSFPFPLFLYAQKTDAKG